MLTDFKNNLCRLCLSGSGKLIDILDPEDNLDFAVEDVIRDLLQCQVEKESGCPWMVCHFCMQKLVEFHFFKIRSNECQLTFKHRFPSKDSTKGAILEKTGVNKFPSYNRSRTTEYPGLIQSDLSSISSEEDEVTNYQPSGDTNAGANGVEASGDLLCHACGAVIDLSKAQSSRNIGNTKEPCVPDAPTLDKMNEGVRPQKDYGIFGCGMLQVADNDGFEVVVMLDGSPQIKRRKIPHLKYRSSTVVETNQKNFNAETPNEIADLERVSCAQNGGSSSYKSDHELGKNVLVLTKDGKRLILLYPKRDKEIVFVSKENGGCMFVVPTNAEPGMNVLAVAVAQGNEVLMTTEQIAKVIKLPLSNEESVGDVSLISLEEAEHVDEAGGTQNQDKGIVTTVETGAVLGAATGDDTGTVLGAATGDDTGKVLGAATGDDTGIVLGADIRTDTEQVLGAATGDDTGIVLGADIRADTEQVLGAATGNDTGTVLGAATGDDSGIVLGADIRTDTEQVLGAATGNETEQILGAITGDDTERILGDITGDNNEQVRDDRQESSKTGNSNSEEMMSRIKVSSTSVKVQDQIQPATTSHYIPLESLDYIPLHSKEVSNVDETPLQHVINVARMPSSSPEIEDEPENPIPKGYLRSVITIPRKSEKKRSKRYYSHSCSSTSSLRHSESRYAHSHTSRSCSKDLETRHSESVSDQRSRTNTVSRDRSTSCRRGVECTSGHRHTVEGIQDSDIASRSTNNVLLNSERMNFDSVIAGDQSDRIIADQTESFEEARISYILSRIEQEKCLEEQIRERDSSNTSRSGHLGGCSTITATQTGSVCDPPDSYDEVHFSFIQSRARLHRNRAMGLAVTKSEISDANVRSQSNEQRFELSMENDSQNLTQIENVSPKPGPSGVIRTKVDDVSNVEPIIEQKYKIQASSLVSKESGCVLVDLSYDTDEDVGPENTENPKEAEAVTRALGSVTDDDIVYVPCTDPKTKSNVLIDLVSDSEHEEVADLDPLTKTDKLAENILVDLDLDSNDSEIIDILGVKDCENVDKLIESPVQEMNNVDPVNDNNNVASPVMVGGNVSDGTKDVIAEVVQDDIAETVSDGTKDVIAEVVQDDIAETVTQTDAGKENTSADTQEEVNIAVESTSAGCSESVPSRQTERSTENVPQGDVNFISASVDQLQSLESSQMDGVKVLVYTEQERKVMLFLANSKQGDGNLSSVGSVRKEIFLIPLTEQQKNSEEEFEVVTVLSNSDNDSVTHDETSKTNKSDTTSKPNSVAQNKPKERNLNRRVSNRSKFYRVRDFGKQKIPLPIIQNQDSQSNFQCKTCKEKYATRQLYKKHFQRSHAKKQFGCGLCPKRYRFIRNCVTHMLDHGIEEKIFTCIYCDKNFKRRSVLNKHLLTHTTRETYYCKRCGKTFALRKSYKLHVRSHLKERSVLGKTVAQDPQRKQMPQKTKMTVRQSNLNDVTNSDLVHSCNLCRKTFRTASSLRSHRIQHIMVKRFGCVICGRFFLNQRRLRFHIMVHKEYKPYKCTVCKKRFAKKAKLNCHLKKHQGQAPFVCQLCGKCLKSLKQLRIHMRSHRRESRLIKLIVDGKVR